MIKHAVTTLLILSSLIASSRCDYTVKLYDHGHDGWEGNSLVVRINNVNVADITLANGGGPYTYTIAAQPNDVISLLFRRNGSHFTECRYELYDPNNNLIAARDCSTQPNPHGCGGPENVYGVLACPTPDMCGVMTIEMFDYWGQGWCGAYLDVFVNNVLTVTGTHMNLSYAWADNEDISIAVRPGDAVDIIFDPQVYPTSWCYNGMGYFLYDTNGDTLAVHVCQDTNGLEDKIRILPCHSSTNPSLSLFLSNNDVQSDKLIIYPSPATDVLHIETKVTGRQYRIVNLQGITVLTGRLDNNTINIESIAKGIYILEVHKANGDALVKTFTKL